MRAQQARAAVLAAGIATSMTVSAVWAWGFALPEVQWERTFGGTYGQGARSVQPTSDGGYVVAGVSSLGGTGTRAYLAKTGSDGHPIWQRLFRYSDYLYQMAYSIQERPEGGYVLAGYTARRLDWTDDVIWVMGTDSDGNLLWTYVTPTGVRGRAYCVAPTNDGRYVVTGQSLVDNQWRVFLIKMDGDGAIEWQRVLEAPFGSEVGRCVRQTGDGGYVVAGESLGGSSSDALLMKTDAEGNLIWRRVSGDEEKAEMAESVDLTPDGGYVLTGFSQRPVDPYDRQLLVARTDGDGTLLWEKTFGGSSDDRGYSVARTFDGGCIIAGHVRLQGSAHDDAYLAKIASDGDLLWEITLGGEGYDYAFAARQTTDGGYVVAGATDSFSAGNDVYLIKLGPDFLADLAVEKEATDLTPYVGAKVTFTVTVTNLGPTEAPGVTVTDEISRGYSYFSHSTSAGSYDPHTGLWAVGTLAYPASETLEVTVIVLAGGEYTNTARAASTIVDPNPANNAASASPAPVPVADLCIVKTVSEPAPHVGDPVTFTLTVANLGPSGAMGVRVPDSLPSGYIYTSHSASAGDYRSGSG